MDREKVIGGLEQMLIHYNEMMKLDGDTKNHVLLYHKAMVEDAIALLKEQEAVVRCKDCKHYRATPGYCAYDRIWQENKGHIWGMYCKPDWFCADGERK